MNPNEPDDITVDQGLLINEANFDLINDSGSEEDYFSDNYDQYLPPKPEGMNATLTITEEEKKE